MCVRVCVATCACVGSEQPSAGAVCRFNARRLGAGRSIDSVVRIALGAFFYFWHVGKWYMVDSTRRLSLRCFILIRCVAPSSPRHRLLECCVDMLCIVMLTQISLLSKSSDQCGNGASTACVALCTIADADKRLLQCGIGVGFLECSDGHLPSLWLCGTVVCVGGQVGTGWQTVSIPLVTFQASSQ